MQSIVDEATAAEFYSRLLKQAPDDLHREFVKHAYEDELEHLQAFTKLYVHFTGQQPRYHIQPVHYPNYKEGILMALKDELDDTAGAAFRATVIVDPEGVIVSKLIYPREVGRNTYEILRLLQGIQYGRQTN